MKLVLSILFIFTLNIVLAQDALDFYNAGISKFEEGNTLGAIKDFNDAKGSATSDYQNHLEKEWLNSLAKKHTIVINEEVLYSIGK